jgi:hypothetical protein
VPNANAKFASSETAKQQENRRKTSTLPNSRLQRAKKEIGDALKAVSKKGTVPLPHCENHEFPARLKGTVPFFETAS